MDEEDLRLLSDIALIDKQLHIETSDTNRVNEIALNKTNQSSESDPVSAIVVQTDSHTPSAINNSCQNFLKEIEKKLLKLLDENRKEQSVLLKYLNKTNKKSELVSDRDKNALQRIRCVGIPYFKDYNGYPQPRNVVVQDRLTNGELCCLDYLTKSHVWKKQDKDCLKKAVMQGCRTSHQLQQPLGSTLADSAEGSNSKVTSELARFSQQSIDWLKISVTDLKGKFSATECEAKWKLHLNPDINKSKWSENEIEMLETITKKHNSQDWECIASELGTGRTGFQCCIQYQTKHSLSEGKWSSEEDSLLRTLVEKFSHIQPLPWTKISWFFQTRSRRGCQDRYLEHLSTNLKKGAFSPEEDKIIISGAKLFKDFGKIARFLPGRVSTQVRSRYYYLISVSMAEFSEEEDELLLYLAKKYHKQWREISKYFQNRSNLQCRKRYEVLCKQRPLTSSTPKLDELLKNYNQGTKATSAKSKKLQNQPKTTQSNDTYNEILDYFGTCSENLFGPRVRNPSTPEELIEQADNLRATMAMLSVSCDLSDKKEVIDSLKNNCNFDPYDIKMLRHLSEDDQKSGSVLSEVYHLNGMLIPPNYHTLTGLNTLRECRGKLLRMTCESEGLPDTWVARQVTGDRRFFREAKNLFCSRLQSLFSLSAALEVVPTDEMSTEMFYKKKTVKPKQLTAKRRKNHAKFMNAVYQEKKRKQQAEANSKECVNTIENEETTQTESQEREIQTQCLSKNKPSKRKSSQLKDCTSEGERPKRARRTKAAGKS